MMNFPLGAMRQLSYSQHRTMMLRRHEMPPHFGIVIAQHQHSNMRRHVWQRHRLSSLILCSEAMPAETDDTCIPGRPFTAAATKSASGASRHYPAKTRNEKAGEGKDRPCRVSDLDTVIKDDGCCMMGKPIPLLAFPIRSSADRSTLEQSGGD